MASSTSKLNLDELLAHKTDWLWAFLKEELTPYPGRINTMTRMLITCVITMLVIMTVRSPNCALGVFFALTLSREDPEVTIRSGFQLVIAFVIGFIYFFMGINLVINDPLTHFLFIAFSLFVIFFVMKTASSFNAASAFSFMVVTSIPIWDKPVLVSEHVASTLWSVFGVILGVVLTISVELLFYPRRKDISTSSRIVSRLDEVQRLLRAYRNNEEIDRDRVIKFALSGTGRLRRKLARFGSLQYGNGSLANAEIDTIITLTDRLIDLSASMGVPKAALSEREYRRLDLLIEACGSMKAGVTQGKPPSVVLHDFKQEVSFALPLLPELEKTFSLLPQLSIEEIEVKPTVKSGLNWKQFFISDAFCNPEHLHFAVKGCLTSMCCYILYTAVDWPGLSTSMATCVITALSTIGSSRQKQFLRMAGAIAGGLIFGIGSQIFIFPYLDSILGFTIFYALVSLIGIWFATSSPRLSYFGLQLALAFYLIVFQSFAFETSLVVGRDRVMGTLLGLVAMWAIFDRLWAKPATEEVKNLFANNMHLLSQLASATNPRENIQLDTDLIRNQLSQGLSRINTELDSILFELGPNREQDLSFRANMMGTYSAQEALFLTQLAINQYRIRLKIETWPDSLKLSLDSFIQCLKESWEVLALRAKGASPKLAPDDLYQPLNHLKEQALEHYRTTSFGEVPGSVFAILDLDTQLVDITQNLLITTSN